MVDEDHCSQTHLDAPGGFFFERCELKKLFDLDALPPAAIIRLPTVILLTGLSRSTIWRRCKDGTFPQPLKLPGTRAVGWKAGRIRAWLSSIDAGEES